MAEAFEMLMHERQNEADSRFGIPTKSAGAGLLDLYPRTRRLYALWWWLVYTVRNRSEAEIAGAVACGVL